MNKIILDIDGMKCGMCEAHINDIIRKSFKIKSVKSNHKKNNSIIILESDISDEKIINVFKDSGYIIKNIKREEAVKKLFWYK